MFKKTAVGVISGLGLVAGAATNPGQSGPRIADRQFPNTKFGFGL
ncbi:MAG: hypothetical protein ABI180_19215 [Microcoleus sp.]